MASLLSLCTLLLLSASPEILPGYTPHDASTGPVYARGWSEADVLEVAEALPGILRRAEDRLQRRLGRPFTTVLAPDLGEMRRLLERLTGEAPVSDRVLGVALPRLDFIVIRQGLVPGSQQFRDVVVHEVTHLVIHRDRDASIPRWFDEGVATWVSGSPRSADSEAYLSFLARAGLLYHLDRLAYVIPRGDDVASTAYIQSFLLVEYLVTRGGEASVPTLLGYFEAGLDTPAALERLTAVPLPRLEAEFTEWVAVRRSLLEAISSVVNVWTVTTLLALVAIVQYLVRRRRRMRALGMEEEEGPRLDALSGEASEDAMAGRGPEEP